MSWGRRKKPADSAMNDQLLNDAIEQSFGPIEVVAGDHASTDGDGPVAADSGEPETTSPAPDTRVEQAENRADVVHGPSDPTITQSESKPDLPIGHSMLEAPPVPPPDVGQAWPIAFTDSGTAAGVEPASLMGTRDVPDTAIDFARIGPFTVRAASVRGRKYREGPNHKPRQDAYSVASLVRREDDGSIGAGFVVAAVCDGVGSSRQSQVGARLASRSICTSIEAELGGGAPLEELSWPRAFEAANTAIMNCWTDGGKQAFDYRGARDEYATNALVMVVNIAGDESVPVAGASIGDAVAFVIRREQSDLMGTDRFDFLTPLKHAGSEGLTHNRTRALPTASPPEPRVFSEVLQAGDLVAIASDGIGGPLDDGDTPFGEALLQWWGITPPDPLAFASTVDAYSRGELDDRTVVAVWFGTGGRLGEP